MAEASDQNSPTPGEGSGPGEITEAMSVRRRESPRRVFIKVDMEGLTGVVSGPQLDPDCDEYEFGRRMLMHDLNAVLDGVFAAGCSEAVVYDAHGAGRNVDLEGVDARAMVISGRPQVQDGFFCGLRDSFGALLLVGYHARAGAARALLPHTYEDDIVAIRLNNSELGEVGMEAAMAGEFGVPLAFVSGDTAAVQEGRELLGPDLETAEVKKGVSSESGICLPAARTAKLLREAASRAVRRAPNLPPVVFQSPTRLEVVFETARSVDPLEGAEGVERTGERSIVTRGPTVVAAYQLLVQARKANGRVDHDEQNERHYKG